MGLRTVMGPWTVRALFQSWGFVSAFWLLGLQEVVDMIVELEEGQLKAEVDAGGDKVAGVPQERPAGCRKGSRNMTRSSRTGTWQSSQGHPVACCSCCPGNHKFWSCWPSLNQRVATSWRPCWPSPTRAVLSRKAPPWFCQKQGWNQGCTCPCRVVPAGPQGSWCSSRPCPVGQSGSRGWLAAAHFDLRNSLGTSSHWPLGQWPCWRTGPAEKCFLYSRTLSEIWSHFAEHPAEGCQQMAPSALQELNCSPHF